MDKICRPLVNSSRRHGEIKEIVEVIQWLNEESKIENNFSATLNNFNMGNLVQARYSPAADCVSIQRFWEDKLKQTPKTPEELREEQAEKERKAKEEAERRKKAEEAEREKRHTESEQKATYKKAMANWNQQKAEAESKRNAELKKQLEQFERAEKAEIEKTYLSRKNTAEIKLSEAQKNEKQGQDALSSLGFFQFREKRSQSGAGAGGGRKAAERFNRSPPQESCSKKRKAEQGTRIPISDPSKTEKEQLYVISQSRTECGL